MVHLRFGAPALILCLLSLPPTPAAARPHWSPAAAAPAYPGAALPEADCRFVSLAERTRTLCPPTSRQLDLVQLTSGPGLNVIRPRVAWGTELMVQRLRELGEDYRRQFPHAPPIFVHDLSRRHGGPLKRHRSHRQGQDVDIRLPLRVGQGYVDATPASLDLRRTWFIIMTLIRSCDVEFIMLDADLQRALYRYALFRGASPEALDRVLQYPFRRTCGVVQHYPHHRNHLHVRYRCASQQLASASGAELCRGASAGRQLGVDVLDVLRSIVLVKSPLRIQRSTGLRQWAQLQRSALLNAAARRAAARRAKALRRPRSWPATATY